MVRPLSISTIMLKEVPATTNLQTTARPRRATGGSVSQFLSQFRSCSTMPAPNSQWYFTLRYPADWDKEKPGFFTLVLWILAKEPPPAACRPNLSLSDRC